MIQHLVWTRNYISGVCTLEGDRVQTTKTWYDFNASKSKFSSFRLLTMSVTLVPVFHSLPHVTFQGANTTRTCSGIWGIFQSVQIPWAMPVQCYFMTFGRTRYHLWAITLKEGKLGLPHKLKTDTPKVIQQKIASLHFLPKCYYGLESYSKRISRKIKNSHFAPSYPQPPYYDPNSWSVHPELHTYTSAIRPWQHGLR